MQFECIHSNIQLGPMEFELIQLKFETVGTISHYGIDSTEFQLDVTYYSFQMLRSFEGDRNYRYPDKPAKANLYQGAPANRHWAVGEPSRSRWGAVEEPSSNIRPSQAVSNWVNGCQRLKLTGNLSRDVKQLREATLERHLY